MLETRHGSDFSVYQSALLMRRVAKRMRFERIDGLPEYLRLLATDAAEAAALAADLRRNVTEFFRDERGLPPARRPRCCRGCSLSRPSDSDAVRAWCCGCSTGEEAYSLAIELLEACGRREVQPRLQVFASDASEDLLQRARLGSYPFEIAESMSRERLERFFVRDERGYRVRPSCARS